MLFGVGFRLVLVVLALAAEKVGTWLRVSGIVEMVRTVWPRDVAADVERVRAALRRG